jgi:hypothetical protein
LGVGLKNNAIGVIKINQLLADKDEPIEDADLFEFMHNGFHQGPISHMDVCMHRPIIATMSKV